MEVLDRVTNVPPAPGQHDLVVARLDGTVRVDLRDLWERAGRVAMGMRRLGVRPGDRVGVLGPNCLQWVLADLGALRAGAVVAGMEPQKFHPDHSLLEHYGLRLVVTGRGADAGPGFIGMDDIDRLAEPASNGSEAPPRHWDARDPVALKFTSGSTGPPKALTASAGSVDSSVRAVQTLFSHGPGDNIFVFLPLSLLQQRFWIYSALAYGHHVTLSSPEAALLTMARTEPTVVMGVPAFFEAARRHIERQADTTVSGLTHQERLGRSATALFGAKVRYLWTGSAPAAPDTLDFFEACGLPIYEGYGMNETCIATKNAPGAVRRGSVGRALPGKRVSIGDDGVVCVASDFPVAVGYDDAPPGASERIFRSGGVVWTGDLGYLDEDGFLFLTGRTDDALVLENGRKILVRPIEDHVKELSEVAECVVCCPREGHLVAVVSPHQEGADRLALEQQVMASNAGLSPDERFHRVVVATEPFSMANDQLSSQGKPRRRQIFERYRREIEQMGEMHHGN
jgi:long-subunit acyl-CoA synthetase (AMP-forming)